jgi:hypothetical protein
VEATATVIIYDQIGNKMWSKTGSAKDFPDRKIRLGWKVHNLKKRKVGTGTYMAIVKTEYGDINSSKKVNTVSIPIGVKEKE